MADEPYIGPERRRRNLTDTDVRMMRDVIKGELKKAVDEGEMLSRPEREGVRRLLSDRDWWTTVQRGLVIAVIAGGAVTFIAWASSAVLRSVLTQ